MVAKIECLQSPKDQRLQITDWPGGMRGAFKYGRPLAGASRVESITEFAEFAEIGLFDFSAEIR